MQLTRIAVWDGSGGAGCPSVYTTDDPETLLIQGNRLDDTTRGNLVQVLDDEDAITIPTETILRAAKMIESQQ